MCDAPLLRSARRSFAPLEKSRRHNRFLCVSRGPIQMIFARAQNVSGIVWTLVWTWPEFFTPQFLAKQQLCTCITCFCTLLCRHCTTTTWKCLILRFLEYVNTWQRFSFCFCELRYSPLEFNSWKVANIWQIKGAGIKRSHFWVTFLPPLPSSLLKLPVFILSLLQYYLTLNVPRLRAVSYFSLQSYCTRNLSTRAAKPRAAKNEGVSSTKSVFSRLVPIPRNLQSRWMR